MSMTLEAGLKSLVPLQIFKWPCRPALALPTAVPCRDLPSDLVRALPRTKWGPYPSTYLVTSSPFANSTEDFEDL